MKRPPMTLVTCTANWSSTLPTDSSSVFPRASLKNITPGDEDSSGYVHSRMTSRSIMPTALSCIDNATLPAAD